MLNSKVTEMNNQVETLQDSIGWFIVNCDEFYLILYSDASQAQAGYQGGKRAR